MTPARHPRGASPKRKNAGQNPIPAPLQKQHNAIRRSLAAKKDRVFDAQAFLATIGENRKSLLFKRKQGIFTQGDTANAVFYIQTGRIKLTVVSKTGKEATIGILGEGDFFWGRLPCGTAASHGLCNRYNRFH